MVYDYRCSACTNEFEVRKALADFDRVEYCECGAEAVRLFNPNPETIRKVSGIPQSPEYNQALGKIIKSTKHLKEVCKEMNVEPVGDEPVDKLHSAFDKERERRREASYDERGWVGDGTS